MMDSSTYEIDGARPPKEQGAFQTISRLGVKTIPACEVCGRQDETLRLVSFPYVVSALVVTHRNAFTGLWCRTHRLQKQLLASLITVVLGWFGIPFGFVFTPSALFKLARGGEQPEDANRTILKELAEAKAKTGDTATAARCLEQALTFGEVESIRRALAQLYQVSPASLPGEPSSKLLSFLVAIVAATLLGLGIGFTDFLFTALFSSLIGDTGSIYVAILSWIPLVALIYLGGLALSGTVRWALTRSRTRAHG
jgi:hypothetical protein